VSSVETITEMHTRVLVRKTEGKRPLGRPRHRWKYNGLGEVGRWGSLVSIVTRLRSGQLGFDSCQGTVFFSLPPHPNWLWGPPSLLPSG